MRLAGNKDMLKELGEVFDTYRSNGYPGIDPELIPIMDTINSELFVPIYSCHGHVNTKRASDVSYLLFIVAFPGIAISLYDYILSQLAKNSMLGCISDEGIYIVSNTVSLSKEVYVSTLNTGERVEYSAWRLEINYSDDDFRDSVWELISLWLDRSRYDSRLEKLFPCN